MVGYFYKLINRLRCSLFLIEFDLIKLYILHLPFTGIGGVCTYILCLNQTLGVKMNLVAKLFLMLFIAFPLNVYSNYKNITNEMHVKINEAIHMAAESYSIKPKLIMSIIHVESKFIPTAKNGSNVGLMQVNTRYHKTKFGNNSYYGIYSNVFVGTSILKDCLNKNNNNTKKALRCYNGGGDDQYAKKVLKFLQSNNIKM